MVRIAFGSVSIGILFGIVNMVLVPLLSATFHGTAAPGALVSAGMILAAAMGPALGRWSDSAGRRVPPVGALVGTSFVGTLLLMCRTPAPVAVGAVLVTLCAYGLSTPYSALVADQSAPQRRTRDFGLVMGVANGAGCLVSLVLALLPGGGMGPALAVLAALTLLPFLPLLSLGRGGPGASRAGPAGEGGGGAVRSVMGSPVLRRFLLMQFCFWFSLGGLFPYFTSFLSAETSISLPDASLWFGASILLSSLVSVAAGRAAIAVAPRRLLLLSVSAIAAVAVLSWAFYGTLVRGSAAAAFGVSAFLVASAALGFYYALSSSVLSLLASPRAQGGAFGMNGIATIVSQALSVWMAGAVISRLGYRSMMLFCAVGFVAAAVLAATVDRSADGAAGQDPPSAA